MTTDRTTTWARAVRGLWLLAVLAGGLISLVGSGGGAIGFPPCTEPWCNQPPPELPSVTVQPAAVTVQVGGTVAFDAQPSNLTGTLSYQWSRSVDGGNSFSTIPGATDRRLVLGAVNLADDGTVLRVLVSATNGASAIGSARLAVGAVPPLTLGDGEFALTDWELRLRPAPDGSLPGLVVQRETSGGNPGAWLRVALRIPAGTGAAVLLALRRDAVYTPATQGALVVIDHGEDCRLLTVNELQSVESQAAFEQAGRVYVANTAARCLSTTWGSEASSASLRAGDFVQVDGPPCTAGEACPDFGPSGATMRFGLRRLVLGAPGDTIGQGLDNWRVTWWRR